jgi:hypothetical protein
MVAPIFKFRNVKIRLSSSSPTFIYGVVPFDGSNPNSTLANGVAVDEVSAVILTVQVSNLTTSPPAAVTVSAYIQNSGSTSSFLASARTLVEDYRLLGNNAFDPLSGNLALSANDQLWVRASAANSCDVIVSLLEIANATAS